MTKEKDKELIKKFELKHVEMVKNKLLIDISNSIKSLKKIFENILDLEFVSLTNSILKIYNDSEIEVDKEEIDKIVNVLYERVKPIFELFLNKTEDDWISYVSESSKIDPKFVKGFNIMLSNLDDSLESVLIEFKTSLDENTISNLLNLDNGVGITDFIKERVIKTVSENFYDRISLKIRDQMQLKKTSLTNNLTESCIKLANLTSMVEGNN